jgi:hypothetical protein
MVRDPPPIVDPFQRIAPPVEPDLTAELEDRVRMTARAIEILYASGEPAGLFFGAAVDNWLRGGGHLTRDWLRLHGRRGSHLTSPQAIARRLNLT